MLAVFQTFSVRHLRLRWPRASLVVASIALGVGTWVATGVLNNSLEKSIQSAVAPLAEVADLHISNNEYGVPDSLAKRVQGIEGVKTVRPWVIDYVHIEMPDRKRRQVMLLGTSLDASGGEGPAAWGVVVKEEVKSRALALGLLGKSPVLVGKALERALPEGEVDLIVWGGGRSHKVARAGSIDASGALATLGGNVLITDIATAAVLADKDGKVTRLDVMIERDADRTEVKQRIQEELSAGPGGPVQAEARFPQENERSAQDALLGIKVGLYLCGGMSLVVGMFLVYNALAVSVAERAHDIGILRSLGATRGQVARLFLGEAALLGLIGTLAGLPLGLGLGTLALGPVQRILTDIFLPLPAREVEIRAANLVGAACAGMVVTLVAALIPALRAAIQEPADAVRRIPPRLGLYAVLAQAALSLFLIALGVTSVALKDSLPTRVGVYAALPTILIGGLLASPLLAMIFARFLRPIARRLFGIEGRLAADNLVRAPGRTGLVIAALAASVALLVQTAGVIRSNEDSILAWLDRSVTADLVLTAGGPISASGQNLAMSDDVAMKVVEEIPGTRVLPVCLHGLDWEYKGGGTRILLVGFDAQLYYDVNRERNAPVQNLHLFEELARQPGTVIVSENFAELYRVKQGDTIHVPGVKGRVSLRVLGAFEDYSWNRGTVFVHRTKESTDALDLRLADVYDLYLPPNTDANEVRERIQQSEWGSQQALFALTRDELRGHVVQLVRQLYGVAYAQLGMVGLVSALGVLTALLISVIQRRRELGLLRAVGASQWQVLRSVLAEAVLMGAIGTMIGVLLGLPIQWYVVQIILFEEGGFAFPVVLPWKEAGVIAAIAVIVATLAGLLPAIHAGRLRIAEAIAYE
jgi:putative ABC transport system permease protein